MPLGSLDRDDVSQGPDRRGPLADETTHCGAGSTLADLPHDGRRAGDLVATERLAPPAQAFGEEGLGAGVEVDAVLGTSETVTLVGIEHVGHAAPILLDGGNDLL